jgi:hypothetical protein
LRGILGLAKCLLLLYQFLSQQSFDATFSQNLGDSFARSNSSKSGPHAFPELPGWGLSTSNNRPHALKTTAQPGTNEYNAFYCDESQKIDIPPFLENGSNAAAFQPGSFYIPPDCRRPNCSGIAEDGKQFISSLAARKEVKRSPTASVQSGPEDESFATLVQPFAPTQHIHFFPLMASLIPNTFSAHLLRTLHSQFQHVSEALENLDFCFVTELSKIPLTQLPVSARWESWMSQAGTAGMVQALKDLRKSLDELCGATVRAGWVVDGWSAFQEGTLDLTKTYGQTLGSAAIKGVEIGDEYRAINGGQGPIARPSTGRTAKSSSDVGGSQFERPMIDSSSTEGCQLGLSRIRPPPGLAVPSRFETLFGHATNGTILGLENVKGPGVSRAKPNEAVNGTYKDGT